MKNTYNKKHFENQVQRMMKHRIVTKGIERHFDIWATTWQEKKLALRKVIMPDKWVEQKDTRWSNEHIKKEKPDAYKIATFIVKFQKVIQYHKQAEVTLHIKKGKEKVESFNGRHGLFSHFPPKGFGSDELTKVQSKFLWAGFKPFVRQYFTGVEEFHLTLNVALKYFADYYENLNREKQKVDFTTLKNNNHLELEIKTTNETHSVMNIYTRYDPSLLEKGRLQFPLACMKFAIKKTHANIHKFAHIRLLITQDELKWHCQDTDFTDNKRNDWWQKWWR